MVEHSTHNAAAVGSSPTPATASEFAHKFILLRKSELSATPPFEIALQFQ